MTFTSVPIVGIACSIFRKEIQALQSAELIDLPVRFLGAMPSEEFKA